MPKLPSLRALLLTDAITCAAMGLALGFGAGPAAAVTGLPASLLVFAGIALLPTAAFMALVARRPRPAAVWLVILGNIAWIAGSLLLLVSGWISPTTPGVVFVIAQAVVVAVLAELELMALRSEKAAMAA